MNEKPLWVYACQILIFACALAILVMIGINADWRTVDIVSVPFKSPSTHLILIVLGTLLGLAIVVRLVKRKARPWEWFVEFFDWFW